MREISNHFVQKSTQAQLWLRLQREDLGSISIHITTVECVQSIEGFESQTLMSDTYQELRHLGI